MSTQSQRIQRSFVTKEYEIFFLRSLSFIHLDGHSHMRRRHSLSHNFAGRKKDGNWIHETTTGVHPARPARRATETDLDTPTLYQDFGFCPHMLPVEQDRTSSPGGVRISDTNEDSYIPLQGSNTRHASKPLIHRHVSFCQNSDVTIMQSLPKDMTSSLPRRSCTSHSTDVAGNNST
eukprot:CCRYP_019468-RA/>CCRYP_019468-RA protein AED:0.00 eAED:0.00 QI:305/1/1/1/0.5/0.33/3/66/176